MLNLSPTAQYWLGWAALTGVLIVSAWILGPQIIARGIKIARDKGWSS